MLLLNALQMSTAQKTDYTILLTVLLLMLMLIGVSLCTEAVNTLPLSKWYGSSRRIAAMP